MTDGRIGDASRDDSAGGAPGHDDPIRTVSGDIVDASGTPTPGRATWSGAGPDAGWPPEGGRIEVRTYDLSGPILPGGFAVWIGAILLGLGVYLVLSATFPAVAAAGSVVVAAGGAALLFLGLSRRRGSWAVYVGAIVLAGGLAGLGQALGILPGGGWTTLAIGLAFLGLGAWRAGRGAGGRALVIVGVLLTVVGGFQAAGSLIPGFPSLGQVIVPLVLVGVGALVLSRALRGR
jgi:hypothetical protein